MLYEYLKDSYGYNEPIFINDIHIDQMSDNAIRQQFKRMVKSGQIERFDTGVYYLPNPSRILKRSYLDPMKVIIKKYISNGIDVYGYFSGIAFANMIGLTTQMPAEYEIVTDREATNGRKVLVGYQNIRVRHANIKITNDNASLLQFLDLLPKIKKYSELSVDETKSKLKDYIKMQGYTKEMLLKVIPDLTDVTAKRLFEWDLVYEFA